MAKVSMATIMIRAAHPQAVLLPQGCTILYFQDMKKEKERKKQQNRGSTSKMIQGNQDQVLENWLRSKSKQS
eukprot:8318226-Ditylum_brightwellii.AAC.1